MKKLFDYLHEHIIIIIIVVVVLAGAISTVQIIKDDAAAKEAEQSGVNYELTDTLYFPMCEVSTLNPLSSRDKDVYYISQLLYSSLFRLDENLNIEPDLVDSYTAKSESGSVELKLKNNVKFSDGSDLTAEDVRFTINEILSIGKSSPYYEYASKIDSVSVSGSRNLTITFEKPSDAALDNLVFPIVSRSSYSDLGNRILGSGQYRYSSYDSMKSLKLKPNKYYYGTVADNKIEFKIIKDKSKASGLMTTDFIMANMSTSSDADVEGEDKNLNVEKITSGELEYLGFNFKNKILAKKEVRQAIAKSIDTEDLIHDNYGGSAVTSDSIYFPGFLGVENKGDAYEQDQKGASELLKKCGYEDRNENGILEDEKGKELKLSVLVNQNNSSRADAAQGIVENLNQIGIKATVKSVSWEEYRTALKEGKFDIYIGGYKFDKKYNLTEMFRKGNNIRYSNSEVLSYVKKLETAQDAESQKKTYEKLKPLLNDDLPYYALCYKSYGFMTVKHFTAEKLPTFFDIYRGCSTWKWEKAVVVQEEEQENKE